MLSVLATVSLLIAKDGSHAGGADEVLTVTIPEGIFVMGSPDDAGREDERPQRNVYLNAFAIDQYEVTNARYFKFVKATGHTPPPNPYGENPVLEQKGVGNLPVVQVTWDDAYEYCHWAGKRLPSEAEWEKAARGPDARIFPWGGEPPTNIHSNFDTDWKGLETLKAVGSLPKGQSFYGVHDMAGNAREWVQDWYDPNYYSSAPAQNPKGPEQGILKVIRGGSWHHSANELRTTARGKGGFALRTDGVGFRCAQDLEVP